MSDMVFFDLETQYLIQEFEGGWNNIKNYGKVKLAIAGIKSGEEYKFFEENQINELFNYLTSGEPKKIVGYNLINFDYEVLRPYVLKDSIELLIPRTFDMWYELYKLTGHKIALDDLARTNLKIGKNEDSMKIPEMWRDGEYLKVKNYLMNDLKITELVYNYGRDNGIFRYYDGDKKVKVKWY